MATPNDPFGKKALEHFIGPSKALEEAMEQRERYEGLLSGLARHGSLPDSLLSPTHQYLRNAELAQQTAERLGQTEYLGTLAVRNRLLHQMEEQQERYQSMVDRFAKQEQQARLSALEGFINDSLVERLARNDALAEVARAGNIGSAFERYSDLIQDFISATRGEIPNLPEVSLTSSLTEALAAQPEFGKEAEAGDPQAVQLAVASFRGTVQQLPEEWQIPSTLLNLAGLIINVLTLLLAYLAFQQAESSPTAAQLTELRESFVAQQRWLGELVESLLVVEQRNVEANQRANQLLEQMRERENAKDGGSR